MHQSFVYSSTAQVLQVTFWHAYRDFFTNPACVEPMLSASDVIKNVTAAFPGASAKVWTDATGAQKFVIAGVGFRKRSGTCRLGSFFWINNRIANKNTTQTTMKGLHVTGTHVPNDTQPPTPSNYLNTSATTISNPFPHPDANGAHAITASAHTPISSLISLLANLHPPFPSLMPFLAILQTIVAPSCNARSPTVLSRLYPTFV